MKRKQMIKKYMLRPVIYMSAFRLMVGLIFYLLAVQVVKSLPMLAAGFLAAFFALLSFLVYLRMDGMKIPRVKYLRPKKKADPIRMYGDMSDHTDDDPPVTFEDLEDDEKDLCSLVSNLAGLIVFLVVSFLV